MKIRELAALLITLPEEALDEEVLQINVFPNPVLGVPRRIRRPAVDRSTVIGDEKVTITVLDRPQPERV